MYILLYFCSFAVCDNILTALSIIKIQSMRKLIKQLLTVNIVNETVDCFKLESFAVEIYDLSECIAGRVV